MPSNSYNNSYSNSGSRSSSAYAKPLPKSSPYGISSMSDPLQISHPNTPAEPKYTSASGSKSSHKPVVVHNYNSSSQDSCRRTKDKDSGYYS